MKVDTFQYKLYIALQLSKTCWCKQSAVPLLNTLSNSVILAQCNESSLSIDKLKPDINVDQSSITLYLFNTWLFFVCFLFSHSLHCASITELLVCSAVEQQIVYLSRFYSIAALCTACTEMCLLSFETSSLLLYCFRFYFLLMMDIAKSETFKNFIILNKALLFLIKLRKTAVQSVPKIKR